LSVKPEISPTWILFASGNSVQIELSLYDPAADRNRPIAAYMVSDVGSDVARSASRAAETVFAAAHELKLAPPPTVAGFDLQGLKNGSQVAGLSSGLALALALAKKLWPENDPGPIAATGEIASSAGGGPLKEISQFENKAKAALALLNHGGLFFYPQNNDQEISSELKNNLEKNGIKSCPVTSVAEALAIALPAIFNLKEPVTELAASAAAPKNTSARTATCLTVTAILLSVIVAGGIYFSSQDRKPATGLSGVTQVTATDKKPNAAAEIVNPKAADHNPIEVKVEINGNSTLEKSLAQLTGSRLQAFIDADKKTLAGLEAISGRVEILSVSESRNPENNSLTSTIRTTFQGQAAFRNLPRKTISIEPVTGSGSGYVRQQLADTAAVLVESIGKSLHELLTPEPLSSNPKPAATTYPETKPKTENNKPKTKDITANRPNQGFE